MALANVHRKEPLFCFEKRSGLKPSYVLAGQVKSSNRHGGAKGVIANPGVRSQPLCLGFPATAAGLLAIINIALLLVVIPVAERLAENCAGSKPQSSGSRQTVCRSAVSSRKIPTRKSPTCSSFQRPKERLRRVSRGDPKMALVARHKEPNFIHRKEV
jgi:hypothetical protein